MDETLTIIRTTISLILIGMLNPNDFFLLRHTYQQHVYCTPFPPCI